MDPPLASTLFTVSKDGLVSYDQISEPSAVRSACNLPSVPAMKPHRASPSRRRHCHALARLGEIFMPELLAGGQLDRGHAAAGLAIVGGLLIEGAAPHDAVQALQRRARRVLRATIFHTTAPFLSGSSANTLPSLVPATTTLLPFESVRSTGELPMSRSGRRSLSGNCRSCSAEQVLE